jgi:hypothetical protein
MIRGKQAVLWEVHKGESASARASMARVEDEELEDEEERSQPCHFCVVHHARDRRPQAEKPTNNTPSKSIGHRAPLDVSRRGALPRAALRSVGSRVLASA